MNNTIAVAIGGVVVGALLVIGYNTYVAPQTGPCTGGQAHCKIVRVITVNGQTQIQPISDETVNAAGVIFWEIETAGYSFPAKGIDFYPATTTKPPANAAPVGEFHNCGPSPANNRVYTCNDKHSAMGTFGYTVTLTGSAAVPPLDPYVVNH